MRYQSKTMARLNPNNKKFYKAKLVLFSHIVQNYEKKITYLPAWLGYNCVRKENDVKWNVSFFFVCVECFNEYSSTKYNIYPDKAKPLLVVGSKTRVFSASEKQTPTKTPVFVSRNDCGCIPASMIAS